MQGIVSYWDNTFGCADWSVADGTVVTGDSLDTDIILSLFLDARAPDSFVPVDGDRRGFWGFPVGSLLWTLDRAKKTDTTKLPLQVRDYAKQALQWLVDTGRVAAIKAEANWRPGTRNAINLVVTVTEFGTTAPRVRTFAWDATNKT